MSEARFTDEQYQRVKAAAHMRAGDELETAFGANDVLSTVSQVGVADAGIVASVLEALEEDGVTTRVFGSDPPQWRWRE